MKQWVFADLFAKIQLELKYSLPLVIKDAFRKDFPQNTKDSPGSFPEENNSRRLLGFSLFQESFLIMHL